MAAQFKSEVLAETWITLGKGVVVTISAGLILFGLVPVLALRIAPLASGLFQ